MLVRNNVRYSGHNRDSAEVLGYRLVQNAAARIRRHTFTVMEIYFSYSDPYSTRVQHVAYTGQILRFPTEDR
jgi:hypothetical protein